MRQRFNKKKDRGFVKWQRFRHKGFSDVQKFNHEDIKVLLRNEGLAKKKKKKKVLLRSKNLTKKRYKFCQAVQVLLIGRFNQERKGLAKE